MRERSTIDHFLGPLTEARMSGGRGLLRHLAVLEIGFLLRSGLIRQPSPMLCLGGSGLLPSLLTGKGSVPSTSAESSQNGMRRRGVANGLFTVQLHGSTDSPSDLRPHVLYTIPVGQNPTGCVSWPQTLHRVHILRITIDHKHAAKAGGLRSLC
jgi:hypothetical protein